MPDPATAVLFDIDGTLVDSNYLHVYAWSRAFAETGADVDAWRVHRSIGMDGSLLVQELLPDATNEIRDRAKELHLRYYLQAQPLMRRVTGARELLDRVAAAGPKVVLATSAPEAELEALREVLGGSELVAAETSSEDVGTAKPRPDIVRAALERSGVDAAHAVFVGDTVWDATACRRAGVRFVGFRSGGVCETELREAGACAVYDDPADLLAGFDDSPIAALPHS
ncbi:HAD family hydrolase [Nocardia donostiensis]|uniref:HAD family hydrolase n=1 Tax=Nocardia donostiensis TaxID=1538463 RepID=A0A1V2TH18_9NOCA|nr:HAD family hydrolase [Nocardia donostiensis]ONM48819.1 HAD family hydrolase [Nocardia donostiensis]OQS12980.1 HAD family hydrolase [Nocardia donostiensis]OQS22926.1 HAD family hydrolase [Nocardia donostiensis]